ASPGTSSTRSSARTASLSPTSSWTSSATTTSPSLSLPPRRRRRMRSCTSTTSTSTVRPTPRPPASLRKSRPGSRPACPSTGSARRRISAPASPPRRPRSSFSLGRSTRWPSRSWTLPVPPRRTTRRSSARVWPSTSAWASPRGASRTAS
ncbi:hypothetical protein LTR53_019551, partial [Teratosphaeriaceae sp. CCFEE 6253]